MFGGQGGRFHWGRSGLACLEEHTATAVGGEREERGQAKEGVVVGSTQARHRQERGVSCAASVFYAIVFAGGSGG